ncbi:MAG: hypothetical protein V3U43_00100, partial [Pseudomonadales bacterium]
RPRGARHSGQRQAVMIQAQAPGKVVLVGEYAVLEGAPSLVMAANRQVQVTLTPNDSGIVSIDSPGITQSASAMRLEGHDLIPLEGALAPSLEPVTRLLEALARDEGAAPALARGFAARLDSTALYADGVKLGLGSSAALAVALAGAVIALSECPSISPDAPGFRRLHALHRAMQGGVGSGIDVAASLLGGLVHFRRSEDDVLLDRLEIPHGVRTAFIWTGTSASTKDFLIRLDRWKGRHGGEYHALLRELSTIASDAVAAAQENAAQAFIEHLGRYGGVLQELGDRSELGIYGSYHGALRDLAEGLGLTYKPCGAGGGDLGVAMTSDDAALARFRSGAIHLGAKPVDLEVEENGLRVVSQHER